MPMLRFWAHLLILGRSFVPVRGLARVACETLVTTGMAVVGGELMTDRGEGQEETKVREYRRLGRTDFEVSDIGFGAGYLNNANVMQVALDMGVNYFDTAELYENGASERAIGEALQGRDRSSVFVTTPVRVSALPSPRCELRLVLLSESSGGGHKFKLRGITVVAAAPESARADQRSEPQPAAQARLPYRRDRRGT